MSKPAKPGELLQLIKPTKDSSGSQPKILFRTMKVCLGIDSTSRVSKNNSPEEKGASQVEQVGNNQDIVKTHLDQKVKEEAKTVKKIGFDGLEIVKKFVLPFIDGATYGGIAAYSFINTAHPLFGIITAGTAVLAGTTNVVLYNLKKTKEFMKGVLRAEAISTVLSYTFGWVGIPLTMVATPAYGFIRQKIKDAEKFEKDFLKGAIVSGIFYVVAAPWAGNIIKVAAAISTICGIITGVVGQIIKKKEKSPQ